MKVVLLGAKGQVGWELQRALAPLGELLAWDRERADLANPEALAAQLRAVAPQAIVNAAAYTAVDKAESEPELAQRVNAEAPKRLAALAAELGIPLVHYSTDYVFDGSGDQPRDEDATTGPLSVYGASKLAGEQGIRASGCTHLILRTSWVYAARGGNFAKTMLRLAAEREQLRVVNDQIGAPTGAELLADGAAHALRSLLDQPERSGTYHLCASGETSWAAYARFVVEQARAKGQALRCQEVQGIPSSDYPTPARRPLNSRLDCRRFESTFGLRLPHWEQGVRRMLDEVIA
ncbi:dTDP-4-dehydrorhamnose reductase [Inhella proteolytica]|uniref:dTDP-4-dehydrorhamnose reductase n=1 Tax=Inhella proteolytica TaxID=2795029 RepID=A0A931J5K2_9BURK|nr:dTDP-4-dehydrorhamnose reductase [Inhella proteolytica]MBH9577949.1 dTDP-4-dehydrorhamnose reductase [Inhella proteolytica]